MTGNVHVGVWLTPQHTTVDRLRNAWRTAEDLGVDSIWLWDHFFPLTGDPAGSHFEGWTLLAAMAADTHRARVGMLVTNQDYRNPDLVADMARTVDCVSGGRTILGLGAGWFARDYEEYGYDFRADSARARSLEGYIQRVKERIDCLVPPPPGPLPLLIGGHGEQVILRIAAQYADAWNTMAPDFAHSNRKLDEWCHRVGRAPAAIERSCCLTEPAHLRDAGRLIEAGARSLIVQLNDPFEITSVERLMENVASA